MFQSGVWVVKSPRCHQASPFCYNYYGYRRAVYIPRNHGCSHYSFVSSGLCLYVGVLHVWVHCGLLCRLPAGRALLRRGWGVVLDRALLRRLWGVVLVLLEDWSNGGGSHMAYLGRRNARTPLALNGGGRTAVTRCYSAGACVLTHFCMSSTQDVLPKHGVH